jgi:hypothetical protein
MVSEICYFSLSFFWAQNFIFYISFFASKMSDNIYYFLSHFDQLKIKNFGLLKCVVKFYISGTHFNIRSGQPNIETAGVYESISPTIMC